MEKQITIQNNSILSKIKKFILDNKNYVIIALLILFVIIVTYKFSGYNVTNNALNEIETNILVKNILQKDYCHNKLKYNKLCDYFVKSAAKPYLTGIQNFGHISLEVIEKLLYVGVRYLDINIFSESFSSDTEPVIAPGEKLGEWKQSQNIIYVKDFFKLIADVAFSEKHLNNYKDPLFIFLNIKTNNKVTLDKVYDIIMSTVNNRLLSKKYRNQKQNIAKTTMCNLMNKLVIFSSDGYQNSKLEEIINLSTNKTSLKRLKFSEFEKLTNKTTDVSGGVQPDFFIKSKFIEFKKGEQNDYIQINDPDINFREYGINNNYAIKLDGALNGQNNTGSDYLYVKFVTANKIYFTKNNLFKPENRGNEISLRAFDIEHGLQTLDSRNKGALTIIVPDDGLLSKNYDVFKTMGYGCQFNSIFFNNIDSHNKKYNKFFNGQLKVFGRKNTGSTSFKLKPKVLRSITNPPPAVSINNLVDTPEESMDIGIDYNFLLNNREIVIRPYLNLPMAIINDNGVAKISPNVKKYNSSLIAELGLTQQPYSISIKNNNKYLVSNDSCCYLFFAERPNNNDLVKQQQFDKDATFYPINPVCNIEGYYSLVISKTKEYSKQQKEILKENDKSTDKSTDKSSDYTGPTYENLYYLRYRTTFNPKTRLYKMNTSFYMKILTLNHGTSTYTIWRPASRDGYKPLGDIAVKGVNMPKYKTVIVSGAIAKPIDYEIVYDNKLINEAFQLSIWKPIPPDGYIAPGFVFKNDYRKPELDIVTCVASEYLTPKGVENKPLWVNISTSNIESDGDTTELSEKINSLTNSSNYYEDITSIVQNRNVFTQGSGLSFWKVEGSDYTVVSNSVYKPNEFDSPGFTISNQENDYLDRLYLEKFPEDKNESLESACFRIDDNTTGADKATDQGKNIISATKQIKNHKIISYRASDEGSNMCINLKTPQWTPFYRETNGTKELVEDSILEFINNNTLKIRMTNNSLQKDDYIMINYNNKNYMNGAGFQIQRITNLGSNIYKIFLFESITDISLFTNSTNKWIKIVNYIDPSKMTKVEVANCRDIDYYGTNWSHFGDKTIRLTANPDYCLTQSNVYGKELGIMQCDLNNPSLKQRFGIADTGQVINLNINNVPTWNCLNFNNNNSITIEPCNSRIRQKWFIKKSKDMVCFSIGSQIYIKVIENRGNIDPLKTKEEIYIDSRITEEYDLNNYHLYLRGEIIGEKKDVYLINLYENLHLDRNNNEIKSRTSIVKGSKDLVNDIPPSSNLLKNGTEVICRNGSILKEKYNEDVVKWKGVISENIDNKKFKVLFSINSVELDNRREAYGRPRYIQEKIVDISDIRIIKSIPSCTTIQGGLNINNRRVSNDNTQNIEINIESQPNPFNCKQLKDFKLLDYLLNNNSITEDEVIAFDNLMYSMSQTDKTDLTSFYLDKLNTFTPSQLSTIKENSKNITIASYYLKDDINKKSSYDSQLKYRLKEYKFELFILNLLSLKNIFTNEEINDIYSEMFQEKLNAISQYSNITN